ncbi:GrpB family protein [Streptomyces sp. NPDC058755]|uniref:GrpB family protein n=1 Tax=Streptomyces sp. NPDC058755 TaxID=3346624 RepID=UPI00367B2DB7
MPYDPAWPAIFARWGEHLRATLGDAVARIDHIGSTSVPGLAAKPVIDIQISDDLCSPNRRKAGPSDPG